jgi:hypothetical protein
MVNYSLKCLYIQLDIEEIATVIDSELIPEKKRSEGARKIRVDGWEGGE